MKKIIKCSPCGAETWYEDNGKGVGVVDAYRSLKSKCKCGDEE